MQRLKPAEIRASSHAETGAGKEEGGPPGAQPTRRPRSLPGPRLELQLRSAPTQAKGAGPQGIGQRPPPLAKTLLCPPRTAGSSRSEAWVPERGVNCLRGVSGIAAPPGGHRRAHRAHPGAQRLCGFGAGLQPQPLWVVFENSASPTLPPRTGIDLRIRIQTGV